MADQFAQSLSDVKYKQTRECERSSKRFLIDTLPRSKPLRFLDIGCGTGLNAEKISALGHEVVGIDISGVAIDKFREHGFEGHVADVLQGLPFEDGAFDCVFASEVIEHVVDYGAFLAELRRVLKPNGKFFLSTPNSSFWAYRLFSVFGKTLTELQHPGHVRFFSKRMLTKVMADAGFTITMLGARHMYFILPESVGNLFRILIKWIGFEKEFRFANQTWFWQLSRFSRTASPFFADTFIATTERREYPLGDN